MKPGGLSKTSNNDMDKNCIKELMLVVTRHFSTKRSRSSTINSKTLRTSLDLIAQSANSAKKLIKKYSWLKDQQEADRLSETSPKIKKNDINLFVV